MEEVRYKFNHSQDLCVLEGAALKLIKIIQSNDQQSKNDALSFLWDSCLSSELFVAQASFMAISDLVGDLNVLEANHTLSGLLTLAPQVHHAQFLVSLVGDILYRQLSDQASPKVTYGIASRPHPFVSLLRTSVTFWPSIKNQLWCFLINESSPKMRVSAMTFLRPVFMFIFCDPHYRPQFSPLKPAAMEILTLLVQDENRHVSREAHTIIRDIVAWLNFDCVEAVAENSYFVRQFLIVNKEEEVCAWEPVIQAAMILKLLRLGQSPDPFLKDLESNFEEEARKIRSVRCINTVVLLLSKCIPFTIGKPYERILNLCSKLIVIPSMNKLVHSILSTSIIPTLPHHSRLSKDTHLNAQTILSHIPQDNIEDLPAEDITLDSAVLPYPDILEQLCVFHLACPLSGSKEDLEEWLNKLDNSEESTFSLLLGLAYLSDVSEDHMETIWDNIFTMVAKKTNKWTYQVLSLIMYKISNPSKSPEDKLKLLQRLSKLGTDRSCVSFLLQIVNSLASKAKLRPLQLQLLYRLWLCEDRIYPHLKSALETGNLSKSADQQLLFTVGLSKAKVMRDICLHNPQLHGADLLPLLSELLNNFVKDSDSLICSLVLETISHLCLKSVIDVRTTVRVLKPKLWNDPREKVFLSFLKVISVVPQFQVSNADFEHFRRELLAELWEKLLDGRQSTAVKAGLIKAISGFPVSDFAIKSLPNFVKDGLKYPPGYNTAVDSEGPIPSPEDILTYIPGDCLIKLLTESADQDLSLFTGLLQELLETEIRDLPRGIYHVKKAGQEPSNLNHFPESSLLKGIVNAILGHVTGKTSVKEKRLTEVLTLLAHPRDRSLPPFNWAQLKGLRSCQMLVMDIVTKQCEYSTSALSMVVSALEQKSPSRSLNLVLLRNLPHYHAYVDGGKSILPFLEDSFDQVMGNVADHKKEMSEMVGLLNVALQRIQDEKSSQVLQNFVDSLLIANALNDDESMQLLMPLLKYASKSCQEDLALTTSKESISKDEYLRKMTISCTLATLGANDDYHLPWINSCIENSVNYENVLELLKHSVFEVFCTIRTLNPRGNRQWLLELMGQLRSLTRQPQSDVRASLLKTLFEVFILAIIAFSHTDQIYSSREDLFSHSLLKTRVFPVALNKLIHQSNKHFHSLGPSLSEWMILMQANEHTPQYMKTISLQSLHAFKNCEKYSEASVWSRLVCVSFNV